MSVFDKPKSTDQARTDLNNDLANPSPNLWNKMAGVLRNTAVKCKGMVCGKSGETAESGDCSYTENKE